MKVKINAESTGKEIIDEHIVPKVKDNGIVVNTGEVKIFVKKKDGTEVEVQPENIRFVFSRE